MRAVLYCLCVAAALSGCDTLNTSKAENPVMEPPPPRVSLQERSAAADLDGANPLYPRSTPTDTTPTRPGSPVQEVGFEQPIINDNSVVAEVNGAPIFAAEVLEPYAVKLAEVAQQVSADELNKGKLQIIRNNLNVHIERKLLAESLKGTLQPEQVEMLDEHIDSMFEQEMEVMKEKSGVVTRLELEEEARKQGTSLAQLRSAFGTRLMAQEFLRSKAGTPPQIGRPEMLSHYREHQDDYLVPLQVLWQQIVVSYDKHGGKRAALEHLEQAVTELRNGVDFGEVARRASDGPRAAQGGQWDWTRSGSLADVEVEKILFSLPPGTISSVIEGQNDFRLVRVIKRREQGYTPFEEVQDEIKETLAKQMQDATIKEVLADMQADAVIWTIFDKKE